jgi:hypothetical protein
MFHLRDDQRDRIREQFSEKCIPDSRPSSPQTGANVKGLQNGALNS